MRYIILTLALLVSFNSYSQYVGDLHIKDIPSEYIIVDVTDRNQYFLADLVLVDYGQMKNGKDLKASYLVDENGVDFYGGKRRIGGVGILNLFAENGWELVQIVKANFGRQFVLRKKEMID